MQILIMDEVSTSATSDNAHMADLKRAVGNRKFAEAAALVRKMKGESLDLFKNEYSLTELLKQEYEPSQNDNGPSQDTETPNSVEEGRSGPELLKQEYEPSQDDNGPSQDTETPNSVEEGRSGPELLLQEYEPSPDDNGPSQDTETPKEGRSGRRMATDGPTLYNPKPDPRKKKLNQLVLAVMDTAAECGEEKIDSVLGMTDDVDNPLNSKSYFFISKYKIEELQKHRCLQHVAKKKWKEYGLIMQMILFSQYLVFTAILTTALAMAANTSDPRVYNDPVDWFRLFCEIITFIYTFVDLSLQGYDLYCSTSRPVKEDISGSDDESNPDDMLVTSEKRLKLEPMVEYYKDDPQLPIYAAPSCGYPLHELIDILLKPDMPSEHICTVQPLAVTRNAAFVVSVDGVDFRDLKADDLGSWKGTGTKRMYFRVLPSGAVRFTVRKPSSRAAAQYYLLTRRYFIHKTYDKFHRMIADVRDDSGLQNRHVMVQYWFDGPPVEIKVKPHGNSLTGQPFFCTAESAKKRHREIAASNKPKDAMQIATQECGGELEAKGMQLLPRNIQQIKNYRRTGKSKDSNVLYSVMLQCKLAEGTSEAFVRDVKAAPDPQCVLFFDWQLKDLVRFLSDPRQFSILTVDTTYNLGEFYVTPTTYKHLMLVDITSRKHPTIAGPILVHQRKDFASFNYFANTLISFEKKLQEVQAFGTDGDQALIEAFAHNFPTARQLRCFIHMKQNILTKLKGIGIPPSVAQEFISDIFGRRAGSTYEEGLVDSDGTADFDSRLQNCRDVWNARESSYQRPGQTSFFDYFAKHHASTVCHTMLRDVRMAVGLGSPPAIFTTNASESLNAALKKKVNFTQTEWPEFNEAMKQFVMAQQDDIIRAVSGRGQYRLTQEYAHLLVSSQEWIRMTPEQRKGALKRFHTAKVKCSMFASPILSSVPCPGPSSSQTTQEDCTRGEGLPHHQQLSVSAEECGISALPFATLDAMWSKAEEYLVSSNHVVPAPGSDSKSKMVTSRSGGAPHFVRVVSPGQYVCDKNCLQWCSSQICSHTLVAAEVNKELELFLEWYTSSGQEPNITRLVQAGLPTGRGRKGGIPKRQRSRTPSIVPDVVVPRPATSKTQPRSHLLPLQFASRPLTSNYPQPTSSTSRIQPTGVSPPTTHSQSMGNFQSATRPLTSNFPQTTSPCQSTSCTPPANPSNVFHSTQQTHSCQVTQSVTPASTLPVSVVNAQAGVMAASSIQLCQGQQVHVHAPVSSFGNTPFASPSAPNTNPFYIRFIEGNIRMCQGCRSFLRCADGSVPAPPFDLCTARAERRSFRDATGILRTPRKEQPAHYHLKLTCIRAVSPDFVPSSLLVPADVLATLSVVHKEYLRLVFGLSFP